MRAFKLVHLMDRPSCRELAARELADSEHALLEAQTAKEYAEAMVRYQQVRIARLTKYLKEEA